MSTKLKRVLTGLVILMVAGMLSHTAYSVILHSMCVPSGCDDEYDGCAGKKEGAECIICSDWGSNAVCTNHCWSICLNFPNVVACGEKGEGTCYKPPPDEYPFLYCVWSYPSEEQCYKWDC